MRSSDVPRQHIALTRALHEKVAGGGGDGRAAARRVAGHRAAGVPASGRRRTTGGRRPAAAAPSDFGPKQNAPAANPFAAQLAKIKRKEQ